MSDNDTAALNRRSTRLIAGTVLMCGAGVIGLAGLGLTAAAVIGTVRARMDRMPVPPRDLARQTWRQAKAATTAGRDAWREVTVLATAPVPDGSKFTVG